MRFALLLAAGLLACGSTHAKEPDAGHRLAASCAICHGSAGRPATAAASALAGMPKGEFVARMNAFRDGTRPATVMHQIAKGYTDAEIAQLAAWFAALPR